MNAAGPWAAPDVSRETLERLKLYESLLRKWNPAINLVSRTTIDAIWTRHFQDSAQVYALAPRPIGAWADLGSGGGFPGMVAAILAQGDGLAAAFTLVESDSRKAAFLSTIARECGVALKVLSARAEVIPPLGADVVSARAMAPLDQLIALADRHLRPGGMALFPKGARHLEELRAAQEKWQFSWQTTASSTDPDAVIYRIKGISRV
ncbi:MAG: 16S rRNA (guanine(527)-N(7))-methyltransferase RsmG [Proteobacteria bacterium]|nr:16S rRNA (guanine(527)-N(7))-methyltransferase RsmG [Pseudomonadota bacterium]MBS0573278.1 16S rRNA (guanine(527)-N(7))-methyltransferase RsmG [Pseudomonadota bacterium]